MIRTKKIANRTILALVLISSVNMFGQPDKNPSIKQGFQHWQNKLTEAQRNEVRSLIDEMRDDKASREEIHTALKDLVAEYGIELPDNPPPREGPGIGLLIGNLSDDQKAVLREKIRSLKKFCLI